MSAPEAGASASWLWRLRDVRLGDPATPRLLLPTLDLPRGEVTAVIGYSGAGKTSLLNLLVGFEKPDAGSVTVHPAARPVFWTPQNGGLWPHLTALEHLRLTRGKTHAETAAELRARLAEFDLAERADARPGTLSVGECARLAVARALAFPDAAALVMDEPLAHVDPARVGGYWHALRRRLAECDAMLVFSTHSPETVLAEATHVLCLKDGRLLYAGAVPNLYQTPPTEELATFLGPVNWLPPAEAARWLGSDAGPTMDTPHPCYRPERLAVEEIAAGDGGGGIFLVERTCFRGAVAEAELCDPRTGESRTFFHRPSGDRLRPGARVRIRCRG